MRWVDKERPLPLAGVSNRRSLVSVWNLCDFIALALVHPRMPGTAWCVSDGEDLSTPDLIRRLAAVMQRKARLFPVPVPLLVLMGALLGKRAELARLCGSLVIETSALRDVLGWLPPVSVSEGLRRTVDWYLAQKDRSAG
jgi:nucleoside-diphosphate-sugar epimerase